MIKFFFADSGISYGEECNQITLDGFTLNSAKMFVYLDEKQSMVTTVALVSKTEIVYQTRCIELWFVATIGTNGVCIFESLEENQHQGIQEFIKSTPRYTRIYKKSKILKK